MADSTGGMFEARLKLEDESSEALKNISDKIDSAVGGTEQLQKEFKKLHSRLDKMHEATKIILKDTNDIGMIPASLLGINDKGSVKDQFLSIRKLAGSLMDFIGGIAVDGMFGLADASLTAAIAVGKLYYVMSGMAMLMKFPSMLVGSAIEATKLTGVMDDLRHQIIMTNDETIKAAKGISTLMLQTGSDIEVVEEAYAGLARLGQLNKKNALELADASIYMAEAWRMNAGDLTRFNDQLSTLYQIGPSNLKAVASAMDYVARSTRASREELKGLVEEISNTLLNKIPNDMRTKVMPRLLADIAAIGGAMADVFGDPRAVLDSFDKVMDIFDTSGQQMRSMIVGLGGATQEEMNKIIGDADAGGFWVAQVTAINKLKDSLGDKRFTQVAGIYADQMGITRDALMKMSTITTKNAKERIELARKELESTKSIREAWQRAQGVFQDVWKRLENIGRAILISIGEPLLDMLIPALDWLGKKLQIVVELFSGMGDEGKSMAKIGVGLGTVVAVIKSGLLPTIKTVAQFFSKWLLPPLKWIAKIALPAIQGAVLAVGLAFAKLALIAIVFIGIVKAIHDWGGAFIDGFGDGLGKVWEMLKIIGVALLLWFAWPLVLVGTLLYGLYEYWDVFYKAIKPGLDDIAKVWKEITYLFSELGKKMSQSTGDMFKAGNKASSLWTTIGGIIEWIIGVIGWLVKRTLWAASIIIRAFGFIALAIMVFLSPVIFIINLIYEGIMAIIGAVQWLTGTGTFSSEFDQGREEIPMAAGGFVKEDGVSAVLHKNEVIIPLEKFPEVIGATVIVEQRDVVTEIKAMRVVLERIARSSNAAMRLQGG